MFLRNLFSALLVGALTVGLPLDAGATTVFFDGFGDADRNNDGTLEGTVDLNNETGPAWWFARGTSGVTLSIDDDTAGIGSLNAIHMDTTTARTRMLGAALGPGGALGTKSLKKIGDKLTLSFDLRSNEVEDSDKSFRFGFSNDGGTGQGFTDPNLGFVPGDNGTNTQTDDNFGYYAALSWGDPNASGVTAEIRGDVVDAVLGNDTFMGGADSIDFGANTTDAAGSINDLVKHSVVFSVERVADDVVTGDPEDYLLELTVDGSTLISRRLSEGGADPHVSAFQYVYIGTNNGRLDYLWDNALVDHIPEPMSIALLAACGLLTIVRRIRLDR